MKRLRIALDCDGVLADCCSGLLRVVEEVTGRKYSASDVMQLDVVLALGLSADEAAAYKAVIDSRRGFAASLVPYPLARQGVRRLRELGEVFCVTTPWKFNPWWRDERDAWLALHFGIDVVHHAEDKSSYEADVFVDDRSDHVRAWLNVWSGRTAVLWRTLQNSAESVPCSAHSVGSWEALYQLARETALRPAPWPLRLEGGLP
jgi:5'(3')-deoxyribonucleotidase